MCGHHRHHHRDLGGPERTAPTAPEHRVSDADREDVVALLHAAGAAGLLEPDELGDRTGAALSAKTARDLAPLTTDLPPGWLAGRRRELRRRARTGRARAELGGRVRAYVGVMVLLVGIWLAVGLADGGWYPWPVWPALGWGIGLASRAGDARGGGATLPRAG